MSLLEAALRRERAVVGVGLAGLAGLAAWYVWTGAGMGMPAWDMTAAVLFPHRLPPVAGSMPAGGPLLVAMWWVMMIAMMTPGAAPLVLLHRRVIEHHRIGAAASASVLLLAGYLTAWLVFSVGATMIQLALQPTGLLSDMMWWSRSAGLSAALLAAAGLYQFSPWKRACLAACRSPARFLAQHAKPGAAAAFALGLRHGSYCVGCCGWLMALLFVGGVMNVLWIVALTALVLAEKLLPGGERVARAVGVLLLLWAAATLLV